MFLSGRPGQVSLFQRLGRGKFSLETVGRGIASALVLAVCFGAAAFAKEPSKSGPAFPGTVALSELPAEARTTHERILAGGPFPFPKDGIVFANRERFLPAHPRGYYHEYTVITPGASNRGARRIVCGGRQMTQPDACFYTADHYASFRRISRE